MVESSVTPTNEPPTTTTGEPSVTVTEEPFTSSTDESSVTTTDEPTATGTDQPSFSSSDETSATSGNKVSATSDVSSTASTIGSSPASIEESSTQFHGRQDFSWGLARDLRLVIDANNPPLIQSSVVQPSSTSCPNICTTFGSRFPYSPLTLLTCCACTYEDPVYAQGFVTNQHSLPLILTIELCASFCDLSSNCVGFSYNAVHLNCLLLDAYSFRATAGSSNWVLVGRRSGSCGRSVCDPVTSSTDF
ncbi:hypothetical protein CNYM01_13188 [Colletotrichum nymphaeae SA-01]|uniref:Apple domain-containing protein n=1 Tax=Colletotrichum nymphaeae SA-01 TaxID=1460502 RepID=A0A135S5T1_9PEZI|nr:hypothetical protein CNYM01_13188 [Colletotrichum nymphaeae SA-01]